MLALAAVTIATSCTAESPERAGWSPDSLEAIERWAQGDRDRRSLNRLASELASHANDAAGGRADACDLISTLASAGRSELAKSLASDDCAVIRELPADLIPQFEHFVVALSIEAAAVGSSVDMWSPASPTREQLIEFIADGGDAYDRVSALADVIDGD